MEKGQVEVEMEWNGCRVEERRAVHVRLLSCRSSAEPILGFDLSSQVERRLPILWGLVVLWLLTIEAAFVVQVCWEASKRQAEQYNRIR
jgi:hypothetical protein